MASNPDNCLDANEGMRIRKLGTEDNTVLVVEFTVSADAVALGSTLRKFPDTTVVLEPIVPTDQHVMPYLWMTQGDVRGFRETIAADSTVETVRQISKFDEGALFHVDWETSENTIHEWLRTRDSVLLRAQGQDGEWRLELRIESRKALVGFQTYCNEHDIAVNIVRIHELTVLNKDEYDVTEKQRELLCAALKMGYFEIPRNATLGEVAAEFDITTEAASQRLRRGQTNLVSSTLKIGPNSVS